MMLANAYAQNSSNLDTLVVTGVQDVPATQTTLSGFQLNQSRVNTNNTAAMMPAMITCTGFSFCVSSSYALPLRTPKKDHNTAFTVAPNDTLRCVAAFNSSKLAPLSWFYPWNPPQRTCKTR